MKRAMMAVVAVALSACGGGVGNVTFSTWGEAYIERGIPVDSSAETGFVDGWSLKYSKFLIVLKEIAISDKAGKIIFKQPNGLLFDLTKTGPFDVQQITGIAAQRYDEVSYAIGPDPRLQISSMAVASLPDATLMRNNNFGVYVEATATKGTASKAFQWGFSLDTLYKDCSSAEFGGKGVNVPTGATETVQLTVHGDHLYYDDLQSPDAKLRFDALAAADKAPTDGNITLDELAAVSLTTLPLGTYGTGGASEVKTLKDFVSALSRTLGHYRGEGECSPTAR